MLETFFRSWFDVSKKTFLEELRNLILFLQNLYVSLSLSLEYYQKEPNQIFSILLPLYLLKLRESIVDISENTLVENLRI